MDHIEFKEGLLKVAEELRSIAETLSDQADQQRQEKTASYSEQDLALGEIGGARSSVDPLTEFCLS